MKLSSRVKLFIAVFVLLTVVLAYGSTVPLSSSDAQILSNQVESMPPTTIGIFLNNAEIALIEFVPGLGPVFGVYSSYSTGLAFSAIAQTHPQFPMGGFGAFLILLLTPIYWLEFFCYSLAVQESIAFLISIRNRDFFKNEWKWTLTSIAVVLAVLFVSARLEVSLINIVQG